MWLCHDLPASAQVAENTGAGHSAWLFFRPGLTMLPRTTSGLWSSCFILSQCNYRCPTPHPTFRVDQKSTQAFLIIQPSKNISTAHYPYWTEVLISENSSVMLNVCTSLLLNLSFVIGRGGEKKYAQREEGPWGILCLYVCPWARKRLEEQPLPTTGHSWDLELSAVQTHQEIFKFRDIRSSREILLGIKQETFLHI